MAGDRQFSKPCSVSIESEDNLLNGCVVKMSVRNHSVSLSIEGGDQWPHMTPSQARRLAKWLVRGAEEVEARRQREGRYWSPNAYKTQEVTDGR
jgi:hypothetical protein